MSPVLRRLGVVALLGTLPLLSGCHHRHHGHVEPVIVYDPPFVWEADTISYSGVDEIEWWIPPGEARVTLDAFDFTGELTVEIYDDTDELVYWTTFIGKGGDLSVVDFTDPGYGGLWFIAIEATDLGGDLQLVID